MRPFIPRAESNPPESLAREVGLLSTSFATSRRMLTRDRSSILGADGRPDHPVRRRIYEHLLRLPGDHLCSIARTLRLDLGTARHHLEILVDRHLVVRQGQNEKRRFYPVGTGSLSERNRLYMDHWKYRDLRLRVLQAVARLGAARPSSVARALGISRQLAAYHLARLEEIGLVRRQEGGFVPSPAARSQA